MGFIRVVIGILRTRLSQVAALSFLGCRELLARIKDLFVSGLDFSAPKGCLIIDIGAGATDLALLSLGRVVSSRSLRVGADAIANSLAIYLKNSHRRHSPDGRGFTTSWITRTNNAADWFNV